VRTVTCETQDENEALKATVTSDNALYLRQMRLIWRGIINIEKEKRKCCIDCDLQVATDNHCVFDLDHLPKYTKVTDVSQMVYGNYTQSQIEEEMSKCELRCRNCHRIKTKERRDRYKASGEED
jgi:hypothetical protein